MIIYTHKVQTEIEPKSHLSLTIDQRIKSRLRVSLNHGQDVGLNLPRGITLKDGDILSNDEGDLVKVVAAIEKLSVVRTQDDLLKARVCYHLGNRHTPIEITPDFVSYQHDHVLDDMVKGLGGEVTVEQLAFEPEAGAYGGHSSAHGHGHDH